MLCLTYVFSGAGVNRFLSTLRRTELDNDAKKPAAAMPVDSLMHLITILKCAPSPYIKTTVKQRPVCDRGQPLPQEAHIAAN